eukprot:COSAG02_NODE_33529_length_498_cov_1.293233_1_plen_91_part_10
MNGEILARMRFGADNPVRWTGSSSTSTVLVVHVQSSAEEYIKIQGEVTKGEQVKTSRRLGLGVFGVAIIDDSLPSEVGPTLRRTFWYILKR